MVTNAIANLANPPSIVRYFSGASTPYMPGCLLPLLDTCFSSILLFQENLEENPNNFIPNLSKQHNIGYAVNPYSGTNPLRGTLNSAETKDLENGRRYVWDFGTDKANGTIRSIGMTNYHRGFHGLKKSEIVLAGMEDYTHLETFRGFNSNSSSMFSSQDALSNYNLYGASVLAASFPGFAPVGIYNKNEILFYKTVDASKTATFQTMHLNYSTLTLKTKNSSWTTEIQKTTQCELSTRFVADDNYLYSFYAVDNNKFAFVKFDIKTFEIIKDEYVTVQDMNLNRIGPKDGIEYRGYYYLLVCDSSRIMKGIYRINTTDFSDFDYASVEDFLHIPSDWANNEYSQWVFMVLAGGLFLVSTKSYGSANMPSGNRPAIGQYAFAIDENSLNTNPIIWRDVLTSYNWGRYGDPYKILPSPAMPNPYCIAASPIPSIGNTSSTNQVKFGINTMFLSTINNLSTPVVKNETQTMKVTYEITEI